MATLNLDKNISISSTSKLTTHRVAVGAYAGIFFSMENAQAYATKNNIPLAKIESTEREGYCYTFTSRSPYADVKDGVRLGDLDDSKGSYRTTCWTSEEHREAGADEYSDMKLQASKAQEDYYTQPWV